MPPGEEAVCLNFKAGALHVVILQVQATRLTETAIIAFGVINIFSDIYILALPIPVVLGLQLDKRTKISVCSLFLVGSVVCVISVVRLMYAKNVETVDPSCTSCSQPSSQFRPLPNIATGDFTPIAILSTLESSAAVMVACMPTWRPLFRFLGRGINSYFGSGKSNNRGEAESLHYARNMTIGRGRWGSTSRGVSAADKEQTTSGGKGRRLSFILGQKRSDTSMSGDSVEKMLHGQHIELGVSNHKTSPSIAATDQTARTSSGSLGAPTPIPIQIRAPTPVALPNSNINTTSTASHTQKDANSKRLARSPPRSVQDPTFSNTSPDYAYKASAGADRWESLMKQQQIKNKAQEKVKRHSGEKLKDKKKARYGEVAYGGAAGLRADGDGESEERLNGDLGLGLGGISVTHTVVNVSSEGK